MRCLGRAFQAERRPELRETAELQERQVKSEHGVGSADQVIEITGWRPDQLRPQTVFGFYSE